MSFRLEQLGAFRWNLAGLSINFMATKPLFRFLLFGRMTLPSSKLKTREGATWNFGRSLLSLGQRYEKSEAAFGWGLCELRHYPRLPWNWGRADRLGGKRETDRCLPHRKGRLGKKKEGRVSIVSRAGSGVFLFVFKTVKSCWVYGCCSHPFQKNHGLAFYQTANRPKSFFARSSWS